MDARMVLLAAVGSGLMVGMAAGASSPPTMKAAPEQPWEKLLRPDPPADPYAIALVSAPQDVGPPSWMEPRSPVYAWEIEQKNAFARSFYDDPMPIAYVPEAFPPLELPTARQPRSEAVALDETQREVHDAAAAAAAIAANVEAMGHRSTPEQASETAALGTNPVQPT